jgi:hypothetical protein
MLTISQVCRWRCTNTYGYRNFAGANCHGANPPSITTGLETLRCPVRGLRRHATVFVLQRVHLNAFFLCWCLLLTSTISFCAGVYLRGHVQLRVWEMQDVDEEAKVFWAQVMGQNAPVQDSELSGDEHPSIPDEDVNDRSSYSPRSSTSSTSRGVHQLQRRLAAIPTSAARNGFNRPPVFGPEKVVQDPRIKALHRQVMNEILLVGVVSAMVRVSLVF